MMGLKEQAFAPLVMVSLEELVPQDHFISLIACPGVNKQAEIIKLLFSGEKNVCSASHHG